jgi:poly(glycerol-phosphate) alpha-glucosyltransferase
LEAWHRFPARLGAPGNWRLVIAGWDQGGHERELRRLVEGLKLGDSVHFRGPVFGDDKIALLRSASAFILPSVSEGLPMVVLEAWSYGLPVLMTPQCNFPEQLAAGAAVYIDANSEGVLMGLQRLARMSDIDRREMGKRGLRLCREHFSPGSTGRRMTLVYDWLSGRAQKPSFVHND